jgi:hypothetical protein
MLLDVLPTYDTVNRSLMPDISNSRLRGETRRLRRQVTILSLTAFVGLFSGFAAEVEVDLISNDVGTANHAIFQWVNPGELTNAQFSPFLVAKGSGTVCTYNRGKNGHVQLQNIPIVTINGVQYLQFGLSIKGQKVSLDTIEIFTSPTPNQDTNNLGELGVKRWDLDRSCWNYGDPNGPPCPPAWDSVVVQLNASRNKKHPVVDLLLYVPYASFASAAPTDYVYFFCVFGAPPNSFGPAVARFPVRGGNARWGTLVQR